MLFVHGEKRAHPDSRGRMKCLVTGGPSTSPLKEGTGQDLDPLFSIPPPLGVSTSVSEDGGDDGPSEGDRLPPRVCRRRGRRRALGGRRAASQSRTQVARTRLPGVACRCVLATDRPGSPGLPGDFPDVGRDQTLGR